MNAPFSISRAPVLYCGRNQDGNDRGQNRGLHRGILGRVLYAGFCTGLCGLVLFLSACATSPEPTATTGREKTGDVTDDAPRVDMLGLQRSLGLNRSERELGYVEKSFDTCEAGYGYSSSRDCQLRHFVVIHFRLQCRTSEGTVSSVASNEIFPIASSRVRWNLDTQEGYTNTDGEGYGQIRAIAPVSVRKKGLKLTTNGKYLILSAEEITRIVTPSNWCEKN